MTDWLSAAALNQMVTLHRLLETGIDGHYTNPTYIYGRLSRCKVNFDLSCTVRCKHPSGVTCMVRDAQIGNPLAHASTSSGARRPLWKSGSSRAALDLSRNCTAPLTWYFAPKERHHGTETPSEFRAEAVRLALMSGLSRRQVAVDLGIGFSTLSRWVRQNRRNSEKPAAQSDLEREVARLRKENRLLREERDILKEATVFFAERSK